MAFDPKYYSTEGNGDYKAFLDHFKKQAEGSYKPVLFGTKTGGVNYKKGKVGRGHLILVNTKDNATTNKKNDGSMPKIEIVDPNEAVRRRAVTQAAKEESMVSKEVSSQGRSQSTPRGQKRKTDSSNSAAVKKSKIRRVKDIFDD